MALAMLLVGLIGHLAAARPRDRVLLSLVGALVVIMAMRRGYYWNIFGRGHGFFTANRVTALLTFMAVFAGPALLRILPRRARK